MANFMKVTESGGTVTVNVTDTLTVNSNEVLTTADFGAVAGAVAEGNHSHQTIGDNILTGQTIEASVTAPAAVYFDAGEGLWKHYKPIEQNRKKVPGLYIGDNSVALNGAIVDLTFDGDILFIDDKGVLQNTLHTLSMRKTIGYRIGTTQFKVNYDEYDYRLRKFGEKIQASDAEVYDFFGYSVSISGDVAVVGAYGEGTCGICAGAAYIFRYNGNVWLEEQKLMGCDVEVHDYFGNSVSISGDVAVVGASGEDTGGNGAGAAYVFRYNGIVWVEEQKLMASDAEVNDFFGSSVSISGDLVVVGSRYEDTGGTDAGAAYIFRYNGSNWSQEAKLVAVDAEAGDCFGWSVCIADNVAIVGAIGEDTGGSDAGTAYVFRYNGINWVEEQKFMASDAKDEDIFGSSVSISGDVAVVGANAAGAAYIFRYNGSVWSEEQKLMGSDAETGDRFGFSVSISGDVAVVGTDAAGAAYMFRYNGSSWVEKQKFIGSDAAAFGRSVSMSDSVAVVGANYEDTGAGAACIFDLTQI